MEFFHKVHFFLAFLGDFFNSGGSILGTPEFCTGGGGGGGGPVGGGHPPGPLDGGGPPKVPPGPSGSIRVGPPGPGGP